MFPYLRIPGMAGLMAAMQQHDGGCVSLSPIQEMEPLMTQHDVAGPVVDIGGMGNR